jgi:hypothetical protein
MSINCCCKILVYLLAYTEYWTSMKSLKNCFQRSNAPREVSTKIPDNKFIHHRFIFHPQQIVNTSKHLFPSSKTDVENLLNYSLSRKCYATQIPPETRHYRPNNPSTHRPSISNTPRLSLTPSADGNQKDSREMNRISTHLQVDRQESMRSNKSFKALHLSPSQASLTRSKSLNIQSTLKHSPSCRLSKKIAN